MSRLLEALRNCQPLAMATLEQLEHHLAATRHDAEPEARTGFGMRQARSFDDEVLAREKYYAAKYGDERL